MPPSYQKMSRPGRLPFAANLMRIVQDDPKWTFKAAAYDRAKRSIESYPEKLETLALDPNRKLTEVPGVGADLASKIKELVETGKCQYHQEQLAKVPKGLLDLLNLQSVGPQKVRLFYKELGIKSVDDLEKAAKDGRLRELPKMDVKSEENILKAIEVYRRASGRFLISTAYDTAQELIDTYGVGIGVASISTPVYIAEITPARIRGRMVAINQIAIVGGIAATALPQ